MPPKPFQVVKATSLFLKYVANQIAIIQQNPLAIIVSFQAHGQLPAILDLKVNFIADGLILAGTGAGADQEVIGKARDLSKIEDHQVEGFLG